MRLGDLDALKENLFIKFGNQLPNGLLDEIDNAPTVSEITKEKLSIAYDQGYEDGKNNWLQEERPQGELKEYKPLEVDYNVKAAVENLKTAYWSNDYEKYAKAFTEADQMIVSAICHYGYIVVKGGAE